MPSIVRVQSSNDFSTSGSGLGQLTGTTSLDMTTASSTATSPASPFTTNRSAGLGNIVAASPDYGNTVLNFSGTTTATSYTVAPTTTPAANRPVVIAVYSIVASGSGNTPTLTGCGLTWSTVCTASSGVRRLTIFSSSGASPTSASLVADFAAQNQSRILMWGYDFINCYASVSGVTLPAAGVSASATTLSAGSVSNSYINTRFFDFYGRASGSSTSRTLGSTTITKFSSSAVAPVYEIGDGSTLTNNDTFTWSTSANSVACASAVGFAGTLGSYITSGGSLYTMSSGVIDLSFPMTYQTGVTASTTDIMTNRIDIFALGATSSSSVMTTSSYTLRCYYSYNKGPDGTSGTADDYYTINIEIYDASPALLTSTTITEAAGRSQNQIWQLKLEIIPTGATTVKLKASWIIPPLSSGSNLTGSIITGDTTPANLNGSVGLLYRDLTSTTTQYIDYLAINDYVITKKQSYQQGINRSAVW